MSIKLKSISPFQADFTRVNNLFYLKPSLNFIKFYRDCDLYEFIFIKVLEPKHNINLILIDINWI